MKTGLVVKIIAVIVAGAVAVTGGVVAVNIISTKEQKAVLERFEDCYNSGDLQGVVECFEPSVQTIYNGANSLMGNFLGISFQDIVNCLPFLSDIFEALEGYDPMGEIPQLHFDKIKIEKIDDNNCKALCTMLFNYDGDYTEEDVELRLIKEDDSWFISVRELIGDYFG